MDIRKEIDNLSKESFIKDYIDVLFDVIANINECYEFDLIERDYNKKIVDNVKADILCDMLKLKAYQDLYQLYKDAE